MRRVITGASSADRRASRTALITLNTSLSDPPAAACNTLTGSIVVALGHERVGVFSNDQPWRERFLAASEAVGEKMWAMPLDEEYKDQLKSPIADLPNIGTRWGGAITAAMFLKQFADPASWVHLDIAGTAWIEKETPYLPEGPSGTPVRTLIQVAMDS